MLGVPAAVYLVFHVTTKRAVLQAASAPSRKTAIGVRALQGEDDETPAAPGVRLLQRIIPPLVVR